MAHGKAHPAEVDRIRKEAIALAQQTVGRANAAAQAMVVRLAKIQEQMRDLTEEREDLTRQFIDAAVEAGWKAKSVAHTVRELGGR